MRSKLLTFLMTALMIVVFIPTFSFAAGTHENASVASVEQTQEDSELLFCEGDIDPDARQVVEKRDTKGIADQRRAAHTRLRELMNGYADTDYYRDALHETPMYYHFTDEQLDLLRIVAEEATAGCTADYEKIKAIYELVAENIYYDYDVINGVHQYTDYCYDAWVSKTTICAGYSQLCVAFLNSIDIPCMYARGNMHAYNVAYDHQNQRWIFFDATWGSKNKYKNGEKIYGGHTNTYFDMSTNYIATLNNHEYYQKMHIIPGDGGCLKYSIQAPDDPTKWLDTDLWEVYVETLSEKNAESVIIPSKLLGMPVVGICRNAFKDCDVLKSITIPDGIISIGNSAFEGCAGLEAIEIPDDVISIGSDAFEGCRSLASANIPGGVTKIGDDTFFNCESLTGITIPDGVTSIGFRAFDGCKSLTDITIPGSVNTIFNSAFYHCDSLESVTIMEGVTTIGVGMFSGCSSLDSVMLPDGLISIGNQAFFGCGNLTNITVPDGVTSIGNSAFSSCGNLSQATIPVSVSSIGLSAFLGCSALCIYCQKYSYAHSYAVENNIDCNLWISLEDCDINIEQKRFHTTGKPIKPAITVMDEDEVLHEGRHYCVLMSDVVVGESSITVKGLGDYTDEVVLPFVIDDHVWNEEYTEDKAATCTEEGIESIHCGVCSAVKDERAIPAAGHQWAHVINEPGLLQNGLEYDQCEVCEIVENEVELPGYAKYYVKSLKVTGKTKAITAKWTKRSESVQKEFNGYEIRYSTKANMSDAKAVRAKKSSSSKTIKNLKKSRKYFVQVRTFTETADGTFYSRWSKKNSVKTK